MLLSPNRARKIILRHKTERITAKVVKAVKKDTWVENVLFTLAVVGCIGLVILIAFMISS